LGVREPCGKLLYLVRNSVKDVILSGDVISFDIKDGLVPN